MDCSYRRRLVSVDRRGAPRVGWRVAWLVTAGAPGLPLVKLARTPLELRSEPGLRAHVTYYATRVLLPPLHRCLSLLGVNVFKWWSSLGWSREPQVLAPPPGGIARYMWRERCALCAARAHRSLCDACAESPQRSVAVLCTQLNVATSHVHACDKICGSCCGHEEHRLCENTECAMLWRRRTARHKLSQLQDVIRQAPPHIRCYETLEF